MMNTIQESDVRLVLECLEGVLGVDNYKRKEYELRLAELKRVAPDKLMLVYIAIMQQHKPICDKGAAIQLKNSLSTMVADESGFVWEKLQPLTQHSIKEQLLHMALNIQGDPSFDSILCSAIAELAGTLVDLSQPWPELCLTIDTLLQQPEAQPHSDPTAETPKVLRARRLGLQLLASVFPFVFQQYAAKLDSLFLRLHEILKQDDFVTQVVCTNTLCELLACLPPRPGESLKPLLMLVSQTLLEAVRKSSEADIKSILDSLLGVVEVAPHFLLSGFDSLFPAGIEVVKGCGNLPDEKIAQMAIEFMVTALEKSPALLCQHSRQQPIELCIADLFRAILVVMRHYTIEPDGNWIQPREYDMYACKESLEDDNISFGMKALSRVLHCIPGTYGIKYLSPALVRYIQNTENWRFKYVALLAASQVGAYVEGARVLAVLVSIVSEHIEHSTDPKIRFAATRSLGILAAECQDEFHATYHKGVLEALILALNDHVPRIRQEACRSLQHFVEKMRPADVDRYLQPLMEQLEKMVENPEMPALQEAAVGVMCSLAEASKETFKSVYYPVVMPSLIAILYMYAERKHKQFRGEVVESLTRIAQAAGPELFSTHFKSVVGIMVYIQETQLEPHDPQKTHLLRSWQRICLLYGARLAPCVGQLVPSILKLVASIASLHLVPSPSQPGTSLPPPVEDAYTKAAEEGECEERSEALGLLHIIVEHIGGDLGPYLLPVEHVFMRALKLPPEGNMRRIVAASFPGLVTALQNCREPSREKLNVSEGVRRYMGALLDTALNDNSQANIEAEVKAMLQVLQRGQTCGYDYPGTVKVFQQLIQLVDNSYKRAVAYRMLQSAPHIDEGELRLTIEGVGKEERLQMLIAETIATLLKLQPKEFAHLLPLVYVDLVDSQGRQQLFGLVIIIAAMEHLRLSGLHELFPELCKLVFQLSKSSDLRVRRTCLAGFKPMVVGAEDYHAACTDNCCLAIQEVLEASMPEQVNRQEWRATQERALRSLVDIIHVQPPSDCEKTTKMIALWLQHLPQKVAAEQAGEQVGLFAHMLATNSQTVIGKGNENVEFVLRVLLYALDLKGLNNTIVQNLARGFRKLLETPARGALVECAGRRFAPEQREQIHNYMHHVLRVS